MSSRKEGMRDWGNLDLNLKGTHDKDKNHVCGEHTVVYNMLSFNDALLNHI